MAFVFSQGVDCFHEKLPQNVHHKVISDPRDGMGSLAQLITHHPSMEHNGHVKSVERQHTVHIWCLRSARSSKSFTFLFINYVATFRTPRPKKKVLGTFRKFVKNILFAVCLTCLFVGSSVGCQRLIRNQLITNTAFEYVRLTVFHMNRNFPLFWKYTGPETLQPTPHSKIYHENPWCARKKSRKMTFSESFPKIWMHPGFLCLLINF